MIFVDFRLDHPILRHAVQRSPGVTLEWIRNQRYPSNGWTMHFWANGDDLDTFHRAIGEDPTVELEQQWNIGERRLYQVAIVGEGADTDLYPILAESGSVIVSAEVTRPGWECHFGFAEQAALDRFFNSCREHGLSYDIRRVYESRESPASDFGLTESQRAALESALEIGYFDVPRQGGLEDLGRHLDISDYAASQRLRRGMKTLVQEIIRDGEINGRS